VRRKMDIVPALKELSFEILKCVFIKPPIVKFFQGSNNGREAVDLTWIFILSVVYYFIHLHNDLMCQALGNLGKQNRQKPLPL
jgi:hypothetical protein